MKKQLSSAAQAVVDAFGNASDGEYVEGVWVVNERTMLAAALRAAADQGEMLFDEYDDPIQAITVENLLAIAKEFEAQ